MSLLRIRCGLSVELLRWQWVLIDNGHPPIPREGKVEHLPKHADSVQLIIPASQVLITRTRLPKAARNRAGSILSFAVEEDTLREPDNNQVSWIGSAGEDDVLAVVDKKGLKQALDALDAAAIRVDEVNCETLLLPWVAGEWSLAWNGLESFVRTGEFEGTATDCGDEISPPLSLQLMLEDAGAREATPTSIALYTIPTATAMASGSASEPAGKTVIPPDIPAWLRELGVPVRFAGHWDWRNAPGDRSISLLPVRKRWRLSSGLLSRLRPAAWIAAVALAVHSMALIVDWALLVDEQRVLRHQMETRFREIFPMAVAVVDPPLQMRRKLIEARHAAGVPDNADFLPMMGTLAPILQELAPGGLRSVAYESGNIALELAIDEGLARRIAVRLRESGLDVNISPVPAEKQSGIILITVRTM